MTKAKQEARQRRRKSIRKVVHGTPERPRLSVYRSNSHIYAQVVDDKSGSTLVYTCSLQKDVKERLATLEKQPPSKTATAALVGTVIAERCLDKGIKQIVFDRNGYLYHGRVKAVADGARKAGLEF
jgi:large subunit ribosomal protein L18